MRTPTTRTQGEADSHDRRARLIVSFLPHPAGLASPAVVRGDNKADSLFHECGLAQAN
ncbi:hypothetical protein SAE02_75960 [Skermanella aerolata]|uniref:Uncharacterized protein n=1 Tax=Skermanella aerolata TaxID=393310 RepID=A0A512E3Y3_9PROT|nr:hypothetical protein SAE02_75960 [Skermanella aerolata]